MSETETAILSLDSFWGPSAPIGRLAGRAGYAIKSTKFLHQSWWRRKIIQIDKKDRHVVVAVAAAV